MADAVARADPRWSLEWLQENPEERDVAGGRGGLEYMVENNPRRYGHFVDNEGEGGDSRVGRGIGGLVVNAARGWLRNLS